MPELHVINMLNNKADALRGQIAHHTNDRDGLDRLLRRGFSRRRNCSLLSRRDRRHHDLRRPAGRNVGGQVGYMFNVEQMVVGIEADGFASSVSQEIEGIPIPGESITFNIGWLASLRARLGPDAGGYMPYVTGGVLAGHTVATSTAYGGESDDAVHFGYTLGGGIEVPVSDAVSVRGEYLFGQLLPEGFTNGGVTQQAGATMHMAKFGANFHF